MRNGVGPTCYLCLCDAVDDGLQRLVAVTLQDSLHAAGSVGECLPHRHVQFVVVFLGCQVLNQERRAEDKHSTTTA